MKRETKIAIIAIFAIVFIGILSIVIQNNQENKNLYQSNENETSDYEENDSDYEEDDSDYEEDDSDYEEDDSDYEEDKKISADESDLWVCAMEIVRQNLKSPSSAKFCLMSDATITHLGNNIYSVMGTVESKNSYGVQLKKSFYVQFTFTGKGFKNESCSFY